MRRWIVWCAAAAAVASGVTVPLLSKGVPARSEAMEAAALAAPNPVRSSDGGVSNVSFYYRGTLRLAGADADELADHLGRPAIIVVTPGTNEQAEVDAIHRTGAKAYRYVQLYW